ncbi:MAG TPA: helix-turn-helix domain-containing protein [Verrucomicrobiae bacterium]|nr:helix-turn-helix domain-containing protein [Verrucomicrobiae bacterium]
MNKPATTDDEKTETSFPRLYLRPDEAARAIGVSRRTLASWQSTRLIGFRRVGRTILFSIADIQAALDRFRIAPTSELPRRRRRMQRITPEQIAQ